MVPNDIWLRTEWLSCRRTSVLRCVERYCAAAAREYRRALRRVQEVEETMAQVEPETGRRLPSQPAQAELLNRRLAAANAEIRRYQTRLYACEREMVALRLWTTTSPAADWRMMPGWASWSGLLVTARPDRRVGL